jgi:hypothetical protein
MSNLSVLDVQNALRESAEQGHDLLAHENMVGLHGRMYPATFKGLDMGGSQGSSWTTSSAIPHENASVQHIHLNKEMNSDVGAHRMMVLNSVPMLTISKGKYGPNRIGEFYVGKGTYATSHGPGASDLHFVTSEGNLSSPFHDVDGNLISDIHELLRNHGKQRSVGVLQDDDQGIVRRMQPDEYTLHKQLASPGKDLVANPLDRFRVAPRGLIHISHWKGSRYDGNPSNNYLYNPITETLKGIG